MKINILGFDYYSLYSSNTQLLSRYDKSFIKLKLKSNKLNNHNNNKQK